MKLSTTLAALALSGCAHLAFAEPAVFPIDDTGFFFPTDPVRFTDIDSSLPDLYLTWDYQDFGGGSRQTNAAPALIEFGVGHFDTPPPTQYAVEVSPNGYSTTMDTQIDGAFGGWIYTLLQFDCCMTLDPVIYSYGGFEDCFSCSSESLGLTPDEILFLPFRVQDLGSTDWNYGWVAMHAENYFDPECFDQCAPGNPMINQVNFKFLAVGYEFEPNTPIITGAGRCPADMTNDFTVDFFDVSAYLGLYADGNLDADLDGSGSLDFFDISEFIERYGDGCLF